MLATLRTELNMAHEAHYVCSVYAGVAVVYIYTNKQSRVRHTSQEILNQVMLDPDLQAIKYA